jgi:hypothetical protein
VFSGSTVSNLAVSISGIDVRDESEPYASCGFPGLLKDGEWTEFTECERSAGTVLKIPFQSSSRPLWFKAKFRHMPTSGFRIPLRLHVEGVATAFIFLNGVMLGKYYGGGDGPQHDFYLLEGLVNDENELMLLSYDGRSGGNEGVTIEVREWRMNGWSGNVDDVEGKPYVMRRQVIEL